MSIIRVAVEDRGEAGTIALLLPETKTARYETQDKPLFEAKVSELCSDCEVLYSNANQDAALQQSQADAALTNGANVLVLGQNHTAPAQVGPEAGRRPLRRERLGAGPQAPMRASLLGDLYGTRRFGSIAGQLSFLTGIAGSIAPLLAHSLMSLALGMAAFTAASFICWLTYQRLARPTLKAWRS